MDNLIAILKRISVGDIGVYTILDTMGDTPIEVSEDIMNILRRSIADNDGEQILHYENDNDVSQNRRVLGAGTSGYHLRLSKERMTGTLPFYGYSDDVCYEPPLIFLGWDTSLKYRSVTDESLITSRLGRALFVPVLSDMYNSWSDAGSVNADPETITEEYALFRGYKMSIVRLKDIDIPLTPWAAVFLMEDGFATNLVRLLLAARNLWMSAKNKDFDLSKKSILLSIEGEEKVGALEIIRPDEDELRGRSFVHSVVRPDHEGYRGGVIKRRGVENTCGAIVDIVYHGTSESFFVGYSLREGFLCNEWNLGVAANSGTKEVKPLFETEEYFRKIYSSISSLMMPEAELSITYRDTPLMVYLD